MATHIGLGFSQDIDVETAGSSAALQSKANLNRFKNMIKKIISGGQTGADRAALDVAIKSNIAHGGWRIPKGRIAEDGPLSEI